MVSADNTSSTINREGRATAHTSCKNAAKNRVSMQRYGHMRWLCQLQAQVGPHHDTGVPLALHRVAHLLQPRSTQLKLAQHLCAHRFQSYSGAAGRSMKAPKLYSICNSPVNLRPLQQPVSIQGVVNCTLQPHSVSLCMHSRMLSCTVYSLDNRRSHATFGNIGPKAAKPLTVLPPNATTFAGVADPHLQGSRPASKHAKGSSTAVLGFATKQHPLLTAHLSK